MDIRMVSGSATRAYSHVPDVRMASGSGGQFTESDVLVMSGSGAQFAGSDGRMMSGYGTQFTGSASDGLTMSGAGTQFTGSDVRRGSSGAGMISGGYSREVHSSRSYHRRY